MKITQKLLGVSAVAGMIFVGATQLTAQREVDEGKNFTVSDSPETTVFNLQNPSTNRHIHDLERDEPKPAPAAAPAPVADCDPGVVSSSVDKYAVSLDKSAPATVALNEPYTYSYTATAKQDLKKVVVEEQIPSGTVYVSSDPEADVKGSNVTWTLYNLEDGQSVPLTLVVKPTTVADLSNCATITAYPEACTTTTVGQPKLAITKTTPEERVLLGDGVPWDITVTNVGDFCAYDVVVTDTLPSGVTHESGQKTLTTDIGTLAPGESRDISVGTTAAATGQHCNVARADSSNAGSAQDDACVTIVEAGLDIVKDGQDMQFLDKTATYTIKVTNTGDVALDDVVVTDTAPSGTEIASAPGADVSGNTATWTTALAAGQSKTFDLKLVGREPGVLCNEASASSSNYGLSDTDDACTEWKGYPALLLEVIDSHDPLLVGEETTYVIQVTNQGTAADTNIDMKAVVPAGLELVSASGDTKGSISGNTVTFAPYAKLEAKEVIQFRVIAKATATGDKRFNAYMTSDLLKDPVPEEEATQVY